MPSPSHSGKAITDGRSIVLRHLVCRGTDGGTIRRIRRVKQGPSGQRPKGKDPSGEIISRRERARSSDEAIVSIDATGQNNPTLSQGPLDRCAWTTLASTQTSCCDCPRGLQRARVEEAWAAYKPARAKVAVDDRFEAVLGKTRRTE